MRKYTIEQLKSEGYEIENAEEKQSGHSCEGNQQQNALFDFTDLESLCKQMDAEGKDQTLFSGKNLQGESVIIQVFSNRVDCITYQQNGWVRRNIYWRDGTREELFEEKWREETKE